MRDENVTDLRLRTRKFALSIIRLYTSLPKTTEAQILGKQMLRSGTSIGAHFHEAHRAKSPADFISKVEGALQEAEETSYWIELLCGADIVCENRVQAVKDELEQLIAIFVTIVRKVKSRR